MQSFNERERLFDIFDKLISEYERDLLIMEDKSIVYEHADTRFIEVILPAHQTQVNFQAFYLTMTRD
jgi:hypothetical protein